MNSSELSLKNVTAVLITKLPEYPKEIKLDGFGEVIIKVNSESVFERYVQARKAKNDIIYVQDDDCTVDYKELFKHYNGKITNAMSGRRQFYDDISGGRITLVGWGAFFPKTMLDSFDKYIEKYGVDYHLLMEADRVFTWFNYPHNTVRIDHKNLPAYIDTDRMSADPKHFKYLKETIAKLKHLTTAKFTSADIWRSLVIGEVIAILILPILKNLKILDGFPILLWLLILPICTSGGLYITYRVTVPRYILVYDIAKYGLVGWLNFFISAGFFNLLALMTGVTQGLWAVVFLGLAFIITVTHSFLWNKFWVFSMGHNGQARREYTLFFIVTAATACVETAVFHLLINIIGAPSGISPELWANISLFVLIPVATLGNFLGYKLLVFRKSLFG